MDEILKNYIKDFKKTNGIFSNFLKKEKDWFYFLCFSNICFEGDSYLARENWEENLLKNNDLCNIIFEDYNNEKWYFIKFIEENNVDRNDYNEFVNNSVNLEKNIYEKMPKKIYGDIKFRFDDFYSSDFKKNLEIIYICNFYDEEKNSKLLHILKDIHINSLFKIFSKKDLLTFFNNKNKTVKRFELTCSSLIRNKKINTFEIGYFNNYAQGIVCNIDASSYFSLYNSSNKNILFSKNVREYFKSKEDTNIKDTIKNERQNFWFFNNGVTFICEDYEIEDNKVILNNFSIINGAQTVSLIGEWYDKTDNSKMYVLTKIIKLNYKDKLNNCDSFAEKVIQYTNTQKPIKSRDLKSNKKEMIELQKELFDKFNINLIIRRGELYKQPRLSNENQNSYWKHISNELYAQIFLSMLLQKPDKAIQMKSKIFNDDKFYNNIFNNNKFKIGDLKIIIYNYSKINDLINDIIREYETYDEEQEIARRLKMWIYAYITLLSICAFKYNNFRGQELFNILEDSNFNINNGDIAEIKGNNFEAEANIKDIIKSFIFEAKVSLEDYRNNTINKRSKGLLSFSYKNQEYLNLIKKMIIKYFVSDDYLNKICFSFNLL